ncbi:MAG: hypothetical protein JJD97_07420 [Gemmatimonadaceae bacterium]|nr:hypothetical protein [Gemmatimonadaceae bacterium]
MRRRAAIVGLLSLAVAACSEGDDPPAPKTVTIVPDLTGYSTIQLGAASTRENSEPSGTFSYLVVDGALDWYAFATHLSPGRAYRVVLTAADGNEYAVASRRSDAEGALGAHGVETALMNRQCVGAEDPGRRSLESAGTLHVAVKSDGSARGASGNDLLGSRSALPCGGNGDGNFDYVLRSPETVTLHR